MSLAALIRSMAAAGAPPEAIAIAVEAIEASQKIDADRRKKAADRKAAERERARQSRDSHATVTPLSDDNPGPPFLDKESFPQTPFKEIKPNPVRDTGARGSRLPEGWKPAKCDRSTQAGEAIERRGQDWARNTLETFSNHWRAKAGRDACKREWQATWMNWVTEQDKRDGRRTGNGMAGAGQSGSRTLGAIADFIQDGRRE